MLVDEGRLDWAMPVRDYLPEFRLHDAVATEGVTTIDAGPSGAAVWKVVKAKSR
jgi:hypothetical protein